MKITDHFDLGFRDTFHIPIYRSTDAETLRNHSQAPMKAPTRRSFRPIILGGVLVIGISLSLSLFVMRDSVLTHSNAIKGPGPSVMAYDSLPVILALGALLVLGLCLGVLAFILHLLRRVANPLYWQLACWFLVSVGILLRPFVASGVDPLQTTIKGALVAGIVALGVFPGLMRLLNRLKPEPGLLHVAVPFALGFFLDVAQVIAKTYVPGLAWLR